MTSRKDFLTGLFRLLEAKAIAYCVLRNYEDLLADGPAADIDLLVEKNDLASFNESLQTAAMETQHRLVHQTRFVNHSRVFWSAQSEFVRIDYDTEMRWRLFPILPARAILEARQKREVFYVPHPRHESVVLFTQAIWMGKLSERYRQQLARLYDACADKEALRRTYREAFGNAGDELVDLQACLGQRKFDAALCALLKRSLVVKTLLRPSAWRDFAGNLVADLQRFWKRLREPAGVSLLYISSTGRERNPEDFLRHMEFLFPSEKSFQHSANVAGAGHLPKRRKIGLKLRRLRALFKGGLFVESYRLAPDADLTAAIKTYGWPNYAARSFVYTEDSRHGIKLVHAASGYQAEKGVNAGMGATEFSEWLVGFIATVLEREKKRGI